MLYNVSMTAHGSSELSFFARRLREAELDVGEIYQSSHSLHFLLLNSCSGLNNLNFISGDVEKESNELLWRSNGVRSDVGKETTLLL